MVIATPKYANNLSMKYIYTLLFTFTILSASLAQNIAGNTPALATKTEERLLNLEKQLTTQQAVLNKQKAALDSLEKVNMVLTAHKDGYSNNIAVISWVGGIILTTGIAVIGFIIPYINNKALESAKADFDKAILVAKTEFKTSLSEAEARTGSLEEKISEETKDLKMNGIMQDMNFCKAMILISYQGYPDSDTYMFWSVELYKLVLEYKSFEISSEENLETVNSRKESAISFMESAANGAVNTIGKSEDILSGIQQLITQEKDKEYIERLKKVNFNYKKLYRASLVNNVEGEPE